MPNHPRKGNRVNHVLEPLLGVGLGGGGLINFQNMTTTGQSLGSGGLGIAIWIFIAVIALGLVAILAGSRGKSELLIKGGEAVIAAAIIVGVVAWGTGEAGAAMLR
jgi:hypothetical protein